jgi:uracil phosphoribosyltransferase
MAMQSLIFLAKQYPGMPVGKVLIQRNEDTALPMLYFSKLPKDIKSR